MYKLTKKKEKIKKKYIIMLHVVCANVCQTLSYLSRKNVERAKISFVKCGKYEMCFSSSEWWKKLHTYCFCASECTYCLVKF